MLTPWPNNATGRYDLNNFAKESPNDHSRFLINLGHAIYEKTSIEEYPL